MRETRRTDGAFFTAWQKILYHQANRSTHMKISIPLIILLISISFASCSREKAFNSTLWIRAAGENVNIRNEMVDDLIGRKLLNSLNRTQIIALLGKPEPYQDTQPRRLYYTVQIRYEMVDPVYIKDLVIELDENDKFKTCGFTEHKR